MSFYVGVCMGIACRAKGAEEIYNYLQEKAEKGIITLVPVRCIGDCVNAPIVCFNGEFLLKQSLEDVKNLISSIEDK